MSTLWLAGTDANLRTGDRLLIVGAKSGGGFEAGLRRVKRIDKDDLNKRTLVSLEPLDYGPTAVTASRIRRLGDCAPRWRRSATTRRRSRTRPHPADLSKASEWRSRRRGHRRPGRCCRWMPSTIRSRADGWVVDRPPVELLVGDWNRFFVMADDELVRGVRAASAARRYRCPRRTCSATSGLSAWLAGGREQIFARAKTVRTLSRASYGITGRVTQLTLDAAWLKDGDDQPVGAARHRRLRPGRGADPGRGAAGRGAARQRHRAGRRLLGAPAGAQGHRHRSARRQRGGQPAASANWPRSRLARPRADSPR